MLEFIRHLKNIWSKLDIKELIEITWGQEIIQGEIAQLFDKFHYTHLMFIGFFVVLPINSLAGITIWPIDMLNKLGIKLILIFSIGLIVSCTKNNEVAYSHKTLEGNAVRNHIFRDGSLGRILVCSSNENQQTQILLNSRFESTSCEEEVSNICAPFVTEVLDFDLDHSAKAEVYYVRCKWGVSIYSTGKVSLLIIKARQRTSSFFGIYIKRYSI